MPNIQFGIGDGVTTQFQLPYPWQTGSSISIYKNDWQGLQLQYSTARTNLRSYSIPTNATWAFNGVIGIDAYGYAPDGTKSTYLTNSASGTRFNTNANITANIKNIRSIYIKPANPSDSFNCYIDGAIGAAGAQVSGSATFSGINGASVLAGIASAGGIAPVPGAAGWYRMWIEFTPLTSTTVNSHVYPLTANPTEWWGDDVEVEQTGRVSPTSYIGTNGAPVTVTDYSVSGANLITFAVAPLPGAILTYNYTPLPWSLSSRPAARFSLPIMGD